MRGTVVKALRRESAAQNRPLRELKRVWRGLDHRQRGGMRAVLGVYRVARRRMRDAR